MYLNIFLFAGMENDVSDLYTRERERERERQRQRESLNLVVTLANACHEIISNLRVNGAHAEYFRSDDDLSRTRACHQ